MNLELNRNKIVTICILSFLIAYGVYTYNSLIRKDEKVKLQWNEIQNAYQRRFELVPNLVSVVKGGADYEKTILLDITNARSRISSLNTDFSGDTYKTHTAAQNQLANSVNTLILSLEKYPEIKGTRAFNGLQIQLIGTERRIKVARKDFNNDLAKYNIAVKSFPSNVIAMMFGFKSLDGFQAEDGSENVIEIKFD